MRFCTKGYFLNLTGEKIPLNRILLLTQTMFQRHFIKMALEKMMGLSRMMVKIILVGQRSRAGLAKVGCPVSTDFISLNPSRPNINKQNSPIWSQYIFLKIQALGFQFSWKTMLCFHAQRSWETIHNSFLVPWKFMENPPLKCFHFLEVIYFNISWSWKP